jgi:hypothetical protein
MRARNLWLLLIVGLGVLLGYLWQHRRANPPPVTAVTVPRPVVPIQNQKTIDFSSGRPVVKDSASDQAILDSAVKEMAEASKDIRFAPTPPPAKK